MPFVACTPQQLTKRWVAVRFGMHLAHNSAKLKTFNLPKHIQLLRFGTGQLSSACARLAFRLVRSSGPLVGGLIPRIRGTMNCRHKSDGSTVELRSSGALRPGIHL